MSVGLKTSHMLRGRLVHVPAHKTATQCTVATLRTAYCDFWCQDEELRASFTVVDVKRPLLGASRADGQRHQHVHPTWHAEFAPI